MENAKNMAVEVVLFKPAEGVSEAQILETAKALQQAVVNMPGYIDRQLLKDAQGQWVDIVWWESMEQALKASDAIMQDERVMPHLGVFEHGDMIVRHLSPVAIETAR